MARPKQVPLTYLGVFLVAMATLMLEILLTRITSVSAWYHLAFFVISLAMLGMTAGAVLVFLQPAAFEAGLVPRRLAQSALSFALTIPICVASALSVPLAPVTDFMSFVALFAVGSLLALPFLLGGITLTLALTRAGLPANVVYGVDLIGAATGCAAIIPVLEVVDAPSAALLAAALAAASAWAFAVAAGSRGWLAAGSAVALMGLCAGNAQATEPPLRPAWVKGLREDMSIFTYTRWNTYSRVTVDKTVNGPPGFWARGAHTPPEAYAPLEQRFIKIDGAAGTVMYRLGADLQKHGYLAWDITAAAHHLRPHGAAAIIGVGGGRDVLEAARVGHRPVVGVELNDLIVDLHRRQMAEFSGLTRIRGVELVSDEARSYFARDTRRYSVVTMSLIDTWASTATGAYSLSENGLYTLEAWRTFLARLEPRGIFSVSRWYVVESPGETARMLALAMDAIWDRGGSVPRDHMIVLQNEIVATLLLSPSPFSAADVDAARRLAEKNGFNTLASPHKQPAHPLLRKLVLQPSRDALHRFSASQKLDLTPPTDSRPFFFNMLKPSAWLQSSAQVNKLDLAFLGNLQATQTLLYATLVSLVLALVTLALPMASRVRELRALPLLDVAAALLYFALIGLGFMFVEIGLLSRLSVFLGHPTLALAVLLGGIILFAGAGSLWSGYIDIGKASWARSYPLIPSLLVVASGLAMPWLMQTWSSAETAVRVAISVALIAPPALGLGLCFPLGLRLAERIPVTTQAPIHLGPWLWGVNGAFGVCASGLALAVSMSWGITATLFAGAGCYLLLLLCTFRLSRPRPE